MTTDDHGAPSRPSIGRNLVARAAGVRPPAVPRGHDGRPVAGVRGDRSTGLDLAGVHPVQTLELDELERGLDALPACASVIGLGGGQADRRRQVRRLAATHPAVPGADRDDRQRAVRAPRRAARGRLVRYLGYAIPEAVYVDFDVIASAPAGLNRAGVGDILCYHTAHLDWRLTRDSRSRGAPVAVRRAAGRRSARAARLGPRRARRHPRRHGHRDPDAHGRAPLGRPDLPRGRLEPPPHRRRRAFLLLQPGEANRSPLHPRPTGRAGRRARIASCMAAGPTRWSRPWRASASTSGRRRWASRGPTPRRRCARSGPSSAKPVCGTRSPTSGSSTTASSTRCANG